MIGGSFMNFYIGSSINDINKQADNVEFSDELIDFIYKMRKHVSLNMSKLYEIDPYSDVVIPKNELSQIIEICKYILDTSLLQTYDAMEEGTQMLQALIDIAQKAISRDLGLISIGD